MEGAANQYTIIDSDGKVVGFEDKQSLQEYLDELSTEIIRERCEAEGLDFDSLPPKKLRQLMQSEGNSEQGEKVYKTKSLINAIEKSELEEETKNELVELLAEYNTEFFLDEYDGLYEVLNEVDTIDM